MSNRWLFLGLLLICGDYAKDTVTLTERQLNDILTTREGCTKALDRLQSFQLLTYEKTPLKKERKKERREVSEVLENNEKNKIETVIKKPVDRLALSMSPESKILKDFFKENKLGNLVKLVPDILNHFSNIESFDNWYKGLTCAKTFPKEKDFSEQSRYVSSSIKRELGLIKEENKNA